MGFDDDWSHAINSGHTCIMEWLLVRDYDYYGIAGTIVHADIAAMSSTKMSNLVLEHAR